MPAPLIVKRPPNLSKAGSAAVIVFIVAPLIGLVFLFQHHRPIHFENPALNLCAHAALIVLPLVWVALMYAKPAVYDTPEGETIIGRWNYFSRTSWWTMFMVLATPLIALPILSQRIFTEYLAHPDDLSTSPARALVIMFLITGLGAFYGAMFLSPNSRDVRLSQAGLRTGLRYFHEWKSIHHISQDVSRYVLYSHANPALPVCSFNVRDPEKNAHLQRYLSDNNVRIYTEPSAALLAVKGFVVLGLLLNVSFSLWLWCCVHLSFIKVILISFSVGILMTIVLEKYRGIAKYGRSPKPVFKNLFDDKISDPLDRRE